MRVKDQDLLEKKAGVVYQIPCSCGYVETKRVLETCIKEHKAAARRGETEKSAITCLGTASPNTVGETSMLYQVNNTTTLLIKEALNVRLTNFELINRDEDITIPECCQPAGPGPCHDDKLQGYARKLMPEQ